MLERGQFLSCLVALFVKIVSGGKERGDIGSRRSPGGWHGLLSSEQFIVNVGTEFMKLSRRQSEQFIPRLIGFSGPVIPIRRMKEPPQRRIMMY